MRMLSQFEIFDTRRFLAEKELEVAGHKPWEEYDKNRNKTGKILGTDLTVGISKDGTSYTQYGDSVQSNLHQEFSVKVPKNIKVPIGTKIVLVNPVGNAWKKDGENYKTHLSVKADDIKIVQQQMSPQSSTQGLKPILPRKEI